MLKNSKISCRTDCGGSSIGKRYSRTDELGIPFAITVDFETLQDQSVTIRNLATLKQSRIPISDLIKTIKDIEIGKISFKDVIEKYGEFIAKENTDE